MVVDSPAKSSLHYAGHARALFTLAGHFSRVRKYVANELPDGVGILFCMKIPQVIFASNEINLVECVA